MKYPDEDHEESYEDLKKQFEKKYEKDKRNVLGDFDQINTFCPEYPREDKENIWVLCNEDRKPRFVFTHLLIYIRIKEGRIMKTEIYSPEETLKEADHIFELMNNAIKTTTYGLGIWDFYVNKVENGMLELIASP